jgi:peptidyl-prolyl cis-trans isomerase NIMA-interacting 1
MVCPSLSPYLFTLSWLSPHHKFSRDGANGKHKNADAGLPAGWEVRHSNSKNVPYFFNDSQRSSQWEPPPGTDMEKLRKYMSENHSAPEISTGVNGKEGGGKIRASHLLVKHKDSRRPSSWREVGLQSIRSSLGSYESSNLQRVVRNQTHQGRSYDDHPRARDTYPQWSEDSR